MTNLRIETELIHRATRVWEKSASPGSIAHDLKGTEARLQRAQELSIRDEITKEAVERERERAEKILQPMQENGFPAPLTLSRNLQSA